MLRISPWEAVEDFESLASTGLESMRSNGHKPERCTP